MGPCPDALFLDLCSDIAGFLPSVSWDILASKASIPFWPGIEPKQVACLQLRNSFLKKFKDRKSPDADSKALAKFLESNDRCRRFRFSEPSDSLLEIARNTAIEIFRDFFTVDGWDFILGYESIQANLLPGPGSSIGATGDSFYHKLAASPMTGTCETLFSLYKREAVKYPLWFETEKIRSSHYGDFRCVEGNKLSYVPKTTEVSRTICTEPLLNMLAQKGIQAVFEKWLKIKFGIDLTVQPFKNQALAREGSLDGSFGTIDLSSASDSISLALLEAICPTYILGWLKETRSPITILPNGEKVTLYMVSSMGNAYTFPLQTILFSSIVIAVYRVLDIKPDYPRGDRVGNFSVFGDDIIVRREAYDLVVRCLQDFGFLVNTDKSFNEGPFRESCGADFWHGRNVRGVYCQSLSTKHDVYSLINRLNVWSANQQVPLCQLVSNLASHVKFLPVPVWESDVAGIKVPFCLAGPLPRDRNTGSVLYKRHLPRTHKISLLNVELLSHLPKRVIINPPGILLTAVGGYAKDGAIIERQRRVSYNKRISVAPCWDYWDPRHSLLSYAGWRRWETFYVALNLGKD